MSKIQFYFKGISNNIVNRIRKNSISKRLLASYLALSIIPIIIVFIVINTTFTNLIKENIISNDKISSNLITQAISTYMNRFDSITNEIIWDSSLLGDIKNYKQLSTSEKDDFNDKLSRLLRSRATYISDIADFTILNEEFDIVYNEGFSYIDSSTKKEEIKMGLLKGKIINWTSIDKGNTDYIAITKPIKIGKYTYGYLFLAIKEKVIIEMFEDYNVEFNGVGIIVDENMEVMLTNNQSILSKILSHNKVSNNHNIKVIKEIDKNTKIIKVDNHKYISTSSHISYASWDLIGLIPYSYIHVSCADIYIVYLLVGILVIAFCIFISILVHKSIINPINEIVNAMNSVSENTIGEIMLITGNDEISFIMKRYNKMCKKIQVLIDAVKKREKEKRELTLRMLQAQINPHFLFNTLGGIRYIAIMNKDTVVANGLEALSKLLRNTILNKDEFISIEDEMENVKNYITIQKIRYGNSFNIRYNIDDNLKIEKILKFILQPIVENCILHGFEDDSDKNYMDINIYDENEFIRFEIIDNGVGIKEDKLNEGRFDIDKFAGIGVKNIKERLELYYEGMYTFDIKSKNQKGTKTSIIIPKTNGGALYESTNS